MVSYILSVSSKIYIRLLDNENKPDNGKILTGLVAIKHKCICEKIKTSSIIIY